MEREASSVLEKSGSLSADKQVLRRHRQQRVPKAWPKATENTYLIMHIQLTGSCNNPWNMQFLRVPA